MSTNTKVTVSMRIVEEGTNFRGEDGPLYKVICEAWDPVRPGAPAYTAMAVFDQLLATAMYPDGLLLARINQLLYEMLFESANKSMVFRFPRVEVRIDTVAIADELLKKLEAANVN